ncbi:MAG: hypothetical protein H6724_17545 [Sandaracinus sp.]|nr:hypothetical protein [Myxococcales bacterium]MCB9621249.1 hypothetical protein [Sandaracinus sp.]MCB9622203.1 hypothetical protein [Sandaracinus sp.]
MRFPLVLALFVWAFGCNKNAPAPSGPSAPTGDVRVAPGFGEVARSGQAGGGVSDGRCAGHFPSAPQHRLTLEQNQLELRVEVDAPGTALWISSGHNHFCNEPGDANVHVGRGAWSAGEYEIRVGTSRAGSSMPYTLRVVEAR